MTARRMGARQHSTTPFFWVLLISLVVGEVYCSLGKHGPSLSDSQDTFILKKGEEEHSDIVELEILVNNQITSNVYIDDELTIKWKPNSTSDDTSSSYYVPHPHDMIALHCGEDVESVPDKRYFDYTYVSHADKSNWASGFGIFQTHMSSSGRLPQCQYRIYREILRDVHYRKIGQSNILFIQDYGEPSQIHLALTGKGDEILVQWTSNDNNPGVVKYGQLEFQSSKSTNKKKNYSSLEEEETDDGYNVLFASELDQSPHTYKASDMCMPPATDEVRFVDVGWLHETVLSNLIPNTKYWYQIRGSLNSSTTATELLLDGEYSWGATHYFTSPLETSPEQEKPFSYIVYGDMGVCLSLDRLPCDIIPLVNSSITTAELVDYEVNVLNASMVHHFGDISYARGESFVWEAWFSLVQPVAASAPYMVNIGNHEYDHYHDPYHNDPSGVSVPGGWHPKYATFGPDSHGECGVPMYQRYHMPFETSLGNSVFWYSFDFGSVHTIMLSSEHDCTANTSPQYQWLEQDLSQVDRSITPWLIVELHRPLYNSEDYAGDYNTSVMLQQCYEDLFLSYKVDLVLAGHYHAYLRSSKINHDKRVGDDELGIYHFTVGSAGAWVDSGTLMPDKDWVDYFDESYGYGRITVHNSSALLWEFIRNANSSALTIPVTVDSFWIKK